MESSPYRRFFSSAKTTHSYARVDAVGLTERERRVEKRMSGGGKIVGREWNCLE
jgi:hypothetical protein